MLTFILEAALRSLLMALAVWTSIRLLRVQAVLAQKIAWVMVLLAAGTMPLVMHAPWLALDRALRIPSLQSLPVAQFLANSQPTQSAPATQLVQPQRSHTEAGHAIPANATAPQFSPASPSSYSFTSSLNHAAPPSHAAKSLHAARASVLPAMPTSGLGTSPITQVASTPVSSSEPIHPDATQPAVPYWNLIRLRFWSIVIYLGIAGLLLLRTFAGAAIATLVWRRAKPIAGVGTDPTHAMSVRVSSDLATPVTIGSTVILPAEYSQWDDAKLRVVLAHEHSHVRQADFYLQLLAAAHAAIFWFSPLGWWLKRKLTELGEALSDRAGLEQAANPACYAQVLLEFAAMPRTRPWLSRSWFAPHAGVAMARTSNLSGRIERILNDRRFRLAFLGGRRHAFITALLVPAALVATVACIRIVPGVEAAKAQTNTASSPQSSQPAVSGQMNTQVTSQAVTAGESTDAVSPVTAVESVNKTDKVDLVVDEDAQDIVPPASPAPVAPVLSGPIAPAPPAPLIYAPRGVLVAPRAPNVPMIYTPKMLIVPGTPAAVLALQSPPAPPVPGKGKNKHMRVLVDSDDDGDSFSIVHENGNGSVNWNGNYNNEVARVREKMNLKGDYIWFERDGKSYVITDPAIIAQANNLFREDPALQRQQAILESKQAELEKRMAEFDPEKAKIKLDNPEMKKKMAELNARLAELQSDKFKKMTADMQVNQEALSNLQEKMGEIQEQLGDIQGQLGEEMGRLGEKQGELGEQMGRIGEEMGRIGEEQGRKAEEASRQMRGVIDQAFKDGKAKPVE